jgi:hypothetical protein
VVIGDLREGALADDDLASIPPYTGLRFLPVVAPEQPRAIEWPAVAESAGGALTSRRLAVIPGLARTHVEYGEESDNLPRSIEVVAAADDQRYADALLRAVLRDGLVLGADGDRAVTFAFEGAALPGRDRLTTPTQAWMRTALEQIPEVRGGDLDGVLVVTPDVPVTDASALRIVADVLHAAFDEPRVALEPRRIAADTLAAWSRPSGASPEHARPADEGDRRWFWGAALLLLALEHVMRRGPRAA